MTDRELLEAAAKAAGVHANKWAEPGDLLPDKGGWVQFIGYGQCSIWNPLTDDGDALRLAVKLGVQLDTLFMDAGGSYGTKARVVMARTMVGTTDYEPHDSDPYAATRRAIVHAVAARGLP